jgi:hypothetical protein
MSSHGPIMVECANETLTDSRRHTHTHTYNTHGKKTWNKVYPMELRAQITTYLSIMPSQQRTACRHVCVCVCIYKISSYIILFHMDNRA